MLRSSPLLLLLPAVALAQTPEIVAKLDAKLDAERAAQRNEDVEILRRLLNKAAGLPDKASVHTSLVPDNGIGDPTKGQFLGDAKEQTVAKTPVGPFDGVYLPGAGVVFTLHVPAGAPTTAHADRLALNSACNTCHQASVSFTHPQSVLHAIHGEPALSDWDRVKRDIRGTQKPTDTPKEDKPTAAVCEPGSLHSHIGTVLAVNAKNVRHLPEKEGITVVVTFDELKPVAAYTYRTYFDPREKDADGKPLLKSVMVMEPQTADSPVGTVLTNKPFSPEELKLLTLGDLHLKQGKHAEACDAYGKGLNRFWQKPFKVTAPASLTAAQKSQYADGLQKGVRDAMKSYAKALLLSDQADRAKEALDMATGFVVLEVSPISTPATSPTAPAKLVVTLLKANIDKAKDADMLKKWVQVERVNFPTTEKK